jgi:KDO2-lipid IV(A) lauroyltransferase
MTKKNSKVFSQTDFFHNIGNQLIVLLLKGVSCLPFWAIYVLSDFLHFLIKNIFKYRYQVITENISAAFPEKSSEEIAKIRGWFYRHFCDLTLESIKLNGISTKQIDQRMSFEGLEEFEKITGEAGGAIVLSFHYNNWEWSSFLQHEFKFPILFVYNPPRNNKPMEDFLTRSRSKWGGEVVPTSRSARTLFDYRSKEEPAVLWLIADQTALATSPFWTTFMNREGAFFAGPERIATKTNLPVFFQHVKKVARGKYTAEFSLLVKDPGKQEPNKVLRSYVQKMEEIIKEEPEYYLWSHRRWKHTRPENIPLIKRIKNNYGR